MREIRQAAIYGKPTQRECAAVAEGLATLGAAVVWRNHGYFDPSGDVFPDADLIVTFGQRLWSAKIAATYRAMSIPVLTVDLPPLRFGGLDETYRALWADHVNWVPGQWCSSDRLFDLGIGVPGVRSGGNGALLCGQVADDAAHCMGASELRKWTQATADTVAKHCAVTWRPHPRDSFRLEGFESMNGAGFSETLQQGWDALVTFNSTCGYEALAYGLPVFCDESAPYAEIANTSLAALGRPRFPTHLEWLGFFARVAYTQWTFTELSNGEAIGAVLDLAARPAEVRA